MARKQTTERAPAMVIARAIMRFSASQPGWGKALGADSADLLTDPQAQVIQALTTGCRTVEVAREIGVTSPVVTGIVNRLVARDVVQRVRVRGPGNRWR